MRFSSLATVLLALAGLVGGAWGQNYVFGPNVRVNDNQPPGSAFTATYSPGQRLIVVRGDTVFVTWWDDRSGSAHVYFARSNDGGQTFLPNVQVDRAISAGGGQTLALDDSGRIHMCWQNTNAANYNFPYYAKSTDGGLTFSMPVRASDSFGNQSANSSMAVSRDGRRVYVVRDDVGPNRIHSDWTYLSRSTDGGATFIKPDVLVACDTYGWTLSPSIALFQDTIVFVACDSISIGSFTYSVLFSRSTDGGATFSPTVQLSDSATEGEDPSIGVDSMGRVYVMWSGYHTLAISDDTGKHFSIARPALWGGYDPSLFVAPGSQLYVGWDETYQVRGVHFAYSPDGGATFLHDVNPADTWNAIEWEPTVAANADGRVFMAWCDNRNDVDGFNSDTYFASAAMSAIEEQPVTVVDKLQCRVAPNPARGPVGIEYQSRPGPVRLAVFDKTGRLMGRITRVDAAGGSHVLIWDCRDGEGRPVKPGVFFIRLETPNGSASRKVVLIEE